jgi:AcrR family transcriptional regulator
MAKAKSTYHHVDQRRVQLETAAAMIDEECVDAISMRKLAARAGVSRTAAYHYFPNKQEMLCAVAMDGFLRQIEAMDIASSEGGLREQLSRFLRSYVKFSTDNPEYYELMLGGNLWRTGQATGELRKIGDKAFRNLRKQVAKWQEYGFVDPDADNQRARHQSTHYRRRVRASDDHGCDLRCDSRCTRRRYRRGIVKQQ